MLELEPRTGAEYGAYWTKLQRENQQIATFIGKELDSTLATGTAVAEDSRGHALTEQCEELREAALQEGLLRHGYQTARPVRAYLTQTSLEVVRAWFHK